MMSKQIGYWGEEVALNYLCKKGMRVLEKNYSIRGGEIDIIMLDGSCTVFVEVKTRAEDCYGTPLEYINKQKRSRIMKTALYYLGRNDVEMRFDAVEVIYTISGGKPEVIDINHIENAFWEGY